MHTEYNIPGMLGVLMNFTLVGIILAYIMIALQFWTRRNGDKKARRALGQLFAIFILCSFAGYMPRLVHFPNWLLISTHVALFASSWAYAYARQADVISDALRDRN